MRIGKISSGVWLCLVLLLFGGSVMLAFFRAGRRLTQSADPEAVFGLPAAGVVCVSLNARVTDPMDPGVLERVRQIDPDYLFIQETHGTRLADLQNRLDGRFTSSTYYPRQNVSETDNDTGLAILSRHPLNESRPIPNHMNGACGVWASTRLGDRQFYVACLEFSEAGSTTGSARDELSNFFRAWEGLHRPPIVAAVESLGSLVPPEGLVTSPGDRLWLFSSDWQKARDVSLREISPAQLHVWTVKPIEGPASRP